MRAIRSRWDQGAQKDRKADYRVNDYGYGACVGISIEGEAGVCK